jgi:hypothetical protein
MVAELGDQTAENMPGVRGESQTRSAQALRRNEPFSGELRLRDVGQVAKEPPVRVLRFRCDDKAKRERFVVNDRDRDAPPILLDRLPRAIQFDEGDDFSKRNGAQV